MKTVALFRISLLCGVLCGCGRPVESAKEQALEKRVESLEEQVIELQTMIYSNQIVAWTAQSMSVTNSLTILSNEVDIATLKNKTWNLDSQMQVEDMRLTLQERVTHVTAPGPK